MPKRIFDLLFSVAALLVLAPVFALIALAIRWDSVGPVLFRQERVGRGGRLFRIRKFRTMVVDAPLQGPAITIGQDPRITRVGAWLRRTKLDELPQLIDVLCGHMSLVGPRPEVPQYVALYPADLRERVEREMTQLLAAVNAQLADYEQLQMIVLVRDAWTIENGLLTPTLKLKRGPIESQVAPLVDSWYAADVRVLWA